MRIIFCILPLIQGLFLNLISLFVSFFKGACVLTNLSRLDRSLLNFALTSKALSFKNERSRLAKSFRTFPSLRLEKSCWKYDKLL